MVYRWLSTIAESFLPSDKHCTNDLSRHSSSPLKSSPLFHPLPLSLSLSLSLSLVSPFSLMTAPPQPLHHLDYLLILDLEAVCDDPTDPCRPEIVEFPWLVFELATLTVLDHKQIFIAPRWNANPNPPPDAVRGLGTDVAFAASLEDAIIQFHAYVYNSFLITGKAFCLLTDGPWDLNDLLFVEAARKAVILAPYFRTYINLRTEFSRCYPTVPVPTDRRTMFAYLDISTEPRASGLAECVALSAVVSRMLRDGHRLGRPEVVTEFDWATLASRVPAIATPVASAIPVGGIIRLRGLPWTCTEDDIAAFLHGLTIVPSGIHFVRNSQGKATGEAFVQLDSVEAVNIALTRHKEMMGRRYIEVFKSSPVDMSNHLGRVDSRRHVNVYSSKAHSSLVGGAVMPPSFPGTASSMLHGSISDASVEFGGLGTPGTVQMGAKGRGGKKESVSAGGGGVSSNGNRASYVVKVSGMPMGAKPDDLLPLLNGLEMVGDGIHLVRGESRECTGEAFVELTSEAWAKKAVARSGSVINVGGMSVVVEVEKSSAAQLRAAVLSGEGEGRPRVNGDGRGKKNGGANGKGVEGRYYVRIRNVADNVGTEEVIQLFEQFRIGDEDVKFIDEAPGSTSNRGPEKGTGERLARVSFPTKEARDTALFTNKKTASLGGMRVILEDGGSDGKWQRPSGPRRSTNGGPATGGDMGASDPSRIVRMRGLPYSSTDDDIVQFFQGYQIAPGGISRGRDRHGRASGEAWVTFVNAEDAREAVIKLDKAHMGSRYIELKF